MINETHPDLHQDYHRLKQISRGGMEAIETSAMNAMWDALDNGATREEAQAIYFSFFNISSHEQRLPTTYDRKVNA